MTSLVSALLQRCRTSGLIAVASSVLVVSSVSAQQSFKSPEQAADALAGAVKSGAARTMLRVLGPDAAEIVESGDAVADKELRERFLTAYEAKHALSYDGDKKAILIVGPDDFPFPIPLTRNRSGWEFDTAAGRQEILYRRIGRNELDAIQTALAYVDAQNDYADKDPAGAGKGVYAQRVVSSPGKKDGLFWSSEGNESPLGELVAEASTEGYKLSDQPQPYHGYFYRILTRQGPNAPGGALNYVVNGKMIGGFALVAYPAEYGNSGVMTFLVNHAGTVYQKDLGERTETIAGRMRAFDPDQTWKKVEIESPQSH
ncbi:DUF2950 domain-containing protein [Bradyrhizobium sp.]|uniref:DUF2950 domain-containing protein n=1 Tax=Bradyrhizobium sp. TaxID=376 RepID=UPI001EB49825|nr:DUF2950 domain-containing protein [Bradyrhizobium sp.]MBV9985869.1 DUF2950 domain-containing protein [Bradyrhizobium sp.]